MTPAVPRHRRIDLPGRGGSVAALELGPADRPIDIVFSHANSFNACTYRSILAPAAERMRILAYDLRGHGQTELPTVTEGRRGATSAKISPPFSRRWTSRTCFSPAIPWARRHVCWPPPRRRTGCAASPSSNR
jgi:pimeloyl-ACP methyl ester carboxylesterase